MRKLDRQAAPACLAAETEEQAQAKRARYEASHYPSGAWRALWNDLDKDKDGVSGVRRALLAMSEGECAYCGLWVGNDHMQVDHILPKERFPFVAYAWENLLPTCDACNRHKASFVPASLSDKEVVDPCLRDHVPHDFLFEKDRLFTEIARDDRLIDPSFDAPDQHVALLMDIPAYVPKSPIGRLTYKQLLHRREIADRLRRVREAARVVVEGDCPPETLQAFAVASSHPTLFRRFAEYWRAMAPDDPAR